MKVDWVMLLTQDIPLVLSNHIKEHRACTAKIGTAYAGGQTLAELFYGSQPHVALASDESQQNYLRRISEIILTLLPNPESQSESIRLLVTEILTNAVLMPLVDSLSDPDVLNQKIMNVIF